VVVAALRALERIGVAAASAAPYVAEFAEAHPYGVGTASSALRALGAGQPLPPAPKTEDLPALLKQLVANDPEVAGKAAFAIGRLAPQDAPSCTALRGALKNKTPYVRRHASLALRRIGPASAPVLMEVVAQGEAVERRLAADVLWYLAREVGVAALPTWQRALADDDSFVRRCACASIGVIGAPARAAIPGLVTALRDKDVGVAQSAALALGHMRSAAHGTVGVLAEVLVEREGQRLGWLILVALGEFGAASEAAVPTIKETVRRRGSLTQPAVEALIKIGPTGHAALVEIVRDERGFAREFALERLVRMRIQPPGLRVALEQAVQDPDSRVRQLALGALGRLKPDGHTSVGALVAALRREPMARIRHSQVPHALAAQAKTAVLFALVADDDERVRWGALRALSLKKPEELSEAQRSQARELVRKAFADKSPQVRVVAEVLLRQAPPTKVTPDLLRWTGATTEEGSRHAIAAALATVGAPAVPVLIWALGQDEVNLRRGAAATIAEMRSVAKATVPALSEALLANDDDARRYARALIAIGSDAVAAWVTVYARVKDPTIRANLRRAMAQHGAAAVPYLDALRKDGDLATRRWTVAILSRIAEPALAALLAAATDGDAQTARSALGGLGRIRGQVSSIAPVLVSALQRADVRRAAEQSLRSQGQPVFQYVERAAVDKDAGVRAGAYAVLGWFGAAALPLLRRGFNDPNYDARAAAVGAAWGLNDAMVPDLIGALRDKSVQIRVAAAVSLGRVKPAPASALPAILRLFRFGSRVERWATRGVLVALDAQVVAPQLARYLTERDSELRRAARHVLVRVGAAAVPSLIDVIKSHGDPGREAAAATLASISAHDALVALLRDKNPGVRASAARGLGSMRRRARIAVPALIAALGDPEAAVTEQVVRALGEIGPGARDAIPKLLAMKSAGRHAKLIDVAIAKIRSGS